MHKFIIEKLYQKRNACKYAKRKFGIAISDTQRNDALQ